MQLTGLEEPEELWDRLKEAIAESQALSAANRKLVTRVGVLERQLSEVGSLTDDELVAELPKRMARALETAQGVAQEIVRRAKKHGASIRQEAADSAAEIVRAAEGQAAKLLSQAAKKADAHIAAAEAEAADIVTTAHKRRKEILAQLQDEALSLHQRVTTLRKDQSRLAHAYDIVERTLSEARRALDPAGPSQPPVPASSNATDGQERPPASRRSAGRRPAAVAPVYDWAPRATNAG